ncbi:hypothetical protein J6524_08530 [Bradyrhizobium sp. WSM 1738]|uniref:hypothetical protein n=1 Tax=Bradyrhizobium hereditatis TaxID=2821405 RepID=UPI001CE30404|nr:hypothetical protein [Bradyrhizobium hereditatis]MCA6114963.1 hypothetical protein [Bradyrhizobium hereditatis]
MPSDPVEPRLGPFVEGGQGITNVGYRDELTGQVVSSVEIPSELIERTVLDRISVEIAFSGDGQIASAATGSRSASSKTVVYVDELIETFLTSNNLHLEEVTIFELRRLLERLEISVRAVQRSIAQLKEASN